ncbi:MAG: hypothetical protein JWP89_3214 [Schlesneria sp.]|nr:hypothetical protein [Schlesneria sp.]
MKCRSAVMLAIGISLAASGCTLGRGGNCNSGLFCSDCIPPWVPTPKYIQCVDDVVVWETGKNCGIHALARYRHQCGQKLTADFSAGFVQAYIDLAEGRGPLPPSVPPSCYWQAYYRSCAGKPRIEEWYAGYQVGLDQGLQSGVSQFRRIDIRTFGCNGGPGPAPGIPATGLTRLGI